MGWDGAVISDSGGFQVMTLAKLAGGKVDDDGVTFITSRTKKTKLTPEDSIDFQLSLRTDMVVVLDDFTMPRASHDEAKKTVERTIEWAKRSKIAFEEGCKQQELSPKPYLLGVVQGGEHPDLRIECIQRLTEIGFDGLGFGGWPINQAGEKAQFDFKTACLIATNAPRDSLLYGLGIGKPDEIVACAKLGFQIFDCVLPTRDGRHGRLYVYNAENIDAINVNAPDFYSFYTPDKQKYYYSEEPVSTACDCLLCANYSRAYLAHLFRTKDISAMRLATIHNLRFYSLLMEKIGSSLYNKA